ncbi:MAG: hypothetical protein M1830_010042 [Pleopsidium flavum]|nr:MAG: hypothetical protein M1830_010042 [Pleopsidium flavum]
MSNPTAARWFVSTDDFLSSNCDYAFPRVDRAEIRHELRHWDFRSYDRIPWPFTFFQLFCRADVEPCYESATEGALVYADVTGTAEHKKAVDELRDSDLVSGNEKDLFDGQQRRIRDKLVSVYKGMKAQSVDEGNHEVDVVDADADADDQKMRRILERNGAYIYPEVADFIISCPTSKEKAAVLNLISGADHYKHPRPTLMLIAMFDDAQTIRYAESSGYVVAYDFLTNQIIIKHWLSSLDHHPLEDPWFTPSSKDGVSYIGSPSDLLQRIVAREGVLKGSPTHGFDLLTRFIAGRWLIKHFGPLGLATTTEPHRAEAASGNINSHMSAHTAHLRDKASLKSLDPALARYTTELKALNIPVKDRNSDGGNEDGDRKVVELKQADPAQILYAMTLDHLEMWETTLQEIAEDDREEGKVKKAENMAKFYDGITRAARSLVKDPEADFTFG